MYRFGFFGVGQLKEKIQLFFESLQNQICDSLESVEPKAKFREDRWKHSEGGGGITRVISDGDVFEKGGVNTSSVIGKLPPSIANRLNLPEMQFFATGISLVIHPTNPYVPTTHANFRYFETESGRWWFGGGADLTPYYPFIDDVRHFHQTLKNACDLHDPNHYPEYKKWCDDYFFIRHRNETRGVGGIFFDYLQKDKEKDFSFVRSAGESFIPAYLPIVKKHANDRYSERERQFQLYRRGRYVEFNLVYDKGTLFGLETNGRIESILMSLPPLVSWIYDFKAEPGSPEAEMASFLKPNNWLGTV